MMPHAATAAAAGVELAVCTGSRTSSWLWCSSSCGPHQLSALARRAVARVGGDHHQDQEHQQQHQQQHLQPQATATLLHTLAAQQQQQQQQHRAGTRRHTTSLSSTSSIGSTRASLGAASLLLRRGYAAAAAAAAASMQPVSPAAVLEQLSRLRESDEAQAGLTPAAVVAQLDRAIIGQDDAKKAVAIAFRNRWRRQRVADPELRREITPKNLLLIGPTGCGKTEIARRLAKLAEAPFLKVEATKFTEVGFHGRDVDSIVRDLVEAALALVKRRCKTVAAGMIAAAVEERILAALLGRNPSAETLALMQARYRAGELDDELISLDLPSQRPGGGDGPGGIVLQGGQMSVSLSMAGMFGGAGGGARERRSLTVAEARESLEDAEAENLLPAELLAKEAVRVAEQEGIVFLDEIDKVVNASGTLRHGSDPSAEGVQRDLLPLIEGSVVATKYGPVATDHVLFIASGAFTAAKPSDMMAELQGRLPIRVELRGLSAADFERILTEPDNSLVFQQQGVKLEFTPEAIREIAELAEQVNKEVENIGARRLHTVLERLVEEVSFDAPDQVAELLASSQQGGGSSGSEGPDGGSGGSGGGRQQHQESDSSCSSSGGYVLTHVIDKQQVREKLSGLLQEQDLTKYIL